MRRRCHLSSAIACILAAGSALGAQTPNRTAPPTPGPPPAVKLPAIQKRALSNGLPVWIVELHEVPVAQVNLLVASGSAADPTGKFGVASLTAAMLTEGAGSRSALEIADAIDFLGANLSTASTFDASAVRLHVPAARLSEALPVMADVALRPAFPPEELERRRQERLTALLQARDDPAAIAAIAFPKIVYGDEHRYGTGATGTAASLRGLTRDDLRAFYQAHYQPSNATLIVVGDMTPEGVLPLLDTAFGGWKAEVPQAKPAVIPEPPQLSGRQVYLIDKPGAAQSQIRIGWIGVPRSTPDYFTLQGLNTVLGGSFTSRLNQNLREQHGYTYGAGSAFDMRASAGPFSAAAGVQTDKTAEALKEFFNELNAIRKPIPPDELARAKNYVGLRFPTTFETTADISRRLEEMLVYRLPDDYFNNYIAKIQGVTAADVHRAAQKYIQPDNFAVVVVGDRKVIEPGVKALNLGPLKVLPLDEILGPEK